MRSTLLSDLAQVLLKNHFPLRDVAAQFLSQSPYQLDLSLGQGDQNTTMTVAVQANELLVTFREGARGYELRLPLNTLPLVLTVTLSDGKGKSTYTVAPEHFLGAKLPEEFRGLHEKVSQYLSSLLPADFFKAADGANKTTKPEAAAQAGAVETESAVEQPEYVSYVVHRTNEPDLKFKGKEIAHVQSFARAGRQFHYHVLQTPGGKFVGLKVGTSVWLGEQDRAQVKVAEKLDELVAFFGFDALAKALYEQLAIAHEEVIE